MARVVFIPSFIPPHKSDHGIASPQHRLEMTRRACADNPLFEVSDIEIAAGCTSYTVKTLESICPAPDEETFFIIGADSLKEIRTWKDYERLFVLSHFIVVPRPGIEFSDAWAEVPAHLRDRFTRQGEHLVHEARTCLVPSPVRGLEISSTRVRALLQAGRSIRYLVTEPVRSYIAEHRLYGC